MKNNFIRFCLILLSCFAFIIRYASKNVFPSRNWLNKFNLGSQSVGWWQDTDCDSCDVPCAYYVLTCGNSALGYSCTNPSMGLYPPGATGSHDARGCMVCPAGTYLGGSNYCECISFSLSIEWSKNLDCTTGCETCGTGTTCISCTTGYYLYNNLCITECPASYFILSQECVGKMLI